MVFLSKFPFAIKVLVIIDIKKLTIEVLAILDPASCPETGTKLNIILVHDW